MILIVTVSDDVTANYVEERLLAREVSYFRLNINLVYQSGMVSVCPSLGEWVIRNDKQCVSSKDVNIVWQRRLPKPKLVHKDKHAEEYLNQEWRLFWKWWINQFPEDHILDPEWRLNRAANKFEQLYLATKLGLKTPDSLVTSDHDDLVKFRRKHCAVVAKTLGGFGKITGPGESMVIYTSRVPPSDTSRTEELKLAPVLFQEEIIKDYELRVTAVGNKLFSCKIESQKNEKTSLDWRHYDLPNTPHSPYDLPDKVGKQLLSISKTMGVSFCSFDLAVTPEGEYVFFEMNPNSQWVWIEKLTDLPITDELISLLCERSAK